MDVKGDLSSIKKSIKYRIEELYNYNFSEYKLVSMDLIDELSELTGEIKREIAVYIDRKGKIAEVAVGDSHTVSLPQVEGKRNAQRLSGIRCIHTHPNGDARLSAVDLSSLKSLKLDAMISIGVKEGHANFLYSAIIDTEQENGVQIFGPYRKYDREMDSIFSFILDTDKKLKQNIEEIKQDKEKVILVGIDTGQEKLHGGKSEAEVSLDELEELSTTAGARVLKKILQKKQKIDSAFVIGKGKLYELALLVQAVEADTVIFDCELTGAQKRNLENSIGKKVVDRSNLILDIFAQRARSKEGKLQVELAQLNYMLPRLMGCGIELSRLGGGIGTRGPGETKLESDRRHIRKRIDMIKKQLEKVENQRKVIRNSRKKVPVFALVGYTNSGKSTLLNKLCNSEAYAKNQLFATLDTMTRKLELEDGNEVLLIDTVGFIRNLPHHLVDAFKSTLEESINADVLIQVLDASDPYFENHLKIVDGILNELGASQKNRIIVLNKNDKISAPLVLSDNFSKIPTFEVSALTGNGLEKLLKKISQIASEGERKLLIKIPYNEASMVSFIHENGKVIKEEYLEDCIKIEAKLPTEKADYLLKFTNYK